MEAVQVRETREVPALATKLVGADGGFSAVGVALVWSESGPLPTTLTA